MKKGIGFYFGYLMNIEQTVKLIKDAGFDCVITNADKKYKAENGKITKQVKLFKKYGLSLSSLHMSYNSDELHYFWEKGEKGETLKRKLIKDVKIAKKYGFKCVVVHLLGEYSLIGEKRLKEVLRVCEKTNIPLAIENINDQKIFLKTFENIKHDMLKFCYDAGHNNVFDKDFNYLDKFGDKLIALHLHDNNGKSDQHTLTSISGSIDWEKIAFYLSKHPEVSLDYEIFRHYNKDLNAEEFLYEAKKQADLLEYLILKAKK